MADPTTGATVQLSVNGHRETTWVDARQTLAEVLRERIELTGTHLGCEQGVCGACTVIVDGAAVRSCLLLAIQADGCQVLTVEGLTPAAEGNAQSTAGLHPLQQAFWDHQALQCGFCTPGFLLTALAAVQENPAVTRESLRERLAGNICRCTGYQSIVDAVIDYARQNGEVK